MDDPVMGFWKKIGPFDFRLISRIPLGFHRIPRHFASIISLPAKVNPGRDIVTMTATKPSSAWSHPRMKDTGFPDLGALRWELSR